MRRELSGIWSELSWLRLEPLAFNQQLLYIQKDPQLIRYDLSGDKRSISKMEFPQRLKAQQMGFSKDKIYIVTNAGLLIADEASF